MPMDHLILCERSVYQFKACDLWDVSYLAVCQNQSELTIPSTLTPLSTHVLLLPHFLIWITY